MNELSVSEVSKMTGISVRTLHYYDEIGLLVPNKDIEKGYRNYNKKHLEVLQQIMFFKELNFELKDIKIILDNPTFNKKHILKKQKNLLQIKRDRLDNLINAIDEIITNREEIDFKMFNNDKYENELEKYKEEAKEKYGKKYEEFESNMKKLSKKDESEKMNKMMDIFKAISECMDDGIESDTVQEKVDEWFNFINNTFYKCDLTLFKGLGELYVADTRFENNINKIKDGLAKFICDAIAYYCDTKK